VPRSREDYRVEQPAPVGCRTMPVTAGAPGDRNDAIAIAKTRPWWPRVINPETATMRGGRWWFRTRTDEGDSPP
jgi:hypothetical protein